eukprot:TRINITY_DN7679_c0_g1_i1.p1 TRINITY_DN7679_c0_g1~~TRINITY_DN7679_c0_g1_i1.p1  ORF type:complete len:326 (-),score=72.47 TRINITY_DN7679_c0_g1_i1:26-1003(-)
MKALLCVLLFVISSSAIGISSDRDAFTSWMKDHSRTYASLEEFDHRFEIFQKNVDFINRQNAKNLGYTLSVNGFADLSNEEFNRQQSLSKRAVIQQDQVAVHPTPSKVKGVPSSLDWRSSGVISPVQTDGECAASWAITATGAVEGCQAIKTGKLVPLSEQNLIDCSSPGGCQDGLNSFNNAFEYIINNHGIDTEASYGPTPSPSKCMFNPKTIGATLNNTVPVVSGNEFDLLLKVAYGPVAVTINASPSSFQFYQTGVYSDPLCSNSTLDEQVLAVGYGSQGKQPYWIIRNNWGTSWGMQGYMLLARNQNNLCGIASLATLPIC